MSQTMKRMYYRAKMTPKALKISLKVVGKFLQLAKLAWEDRLPVEVFLREPDITPPALPLWFLIHWISYIGISIRFFIHREEYLFNPSLLFTLAIFFSIFSLYMIISTLFAIYGGRKAISIKFWWFQITSDILIFTCFYILTLNYESDFFLFYIIPLAMAASISNLRQTSLVVLCICFCFGLVILIILALTTKGLFDPTLVTFLVIVRVYVLRSFVFIFLGLSYAFYHQLERDQRNTLNEIVNSLGSGISIIRRDSMELLYMNDIQRSISPTARTGSSCYAVYHDLEEICSWCPVVDVFETGETTTGVVHREVKGNIIYQNLVSSPLRDKNGNIVAAISITSDITDHIKLVSVLEQTNSGICVLDKERNVWWMNEVLKDWYPSAKLGGKCFNEYMDPNWEIPCEWCPANKTLETGLPNRDYSKTRDSKGRVKHHDLIVSPWIDHNGELRGAIEVVNDVTYELELSELSRYLHSTKSDEHIILDFVIKKFSHMMKMDHCAWGYAKRNGERRQLSIQSEYNQRDLAYFTKQGTQISLNETELEKRFIYQEAILSSVDISESSVKIDFSQSINTIDSQFIMFMPILIEQETAVVICIESADSRQEIDEKRVLDVISRIQTTIDRHRKSIKIGMDLNRLRILGEIDRFLRNSNLASYNVFIDSLKVILAGIASSDGVGFERAMIFLLDKENNEFRGTVGIGPVNVDEQDLDWEKKGKRHFNDIVDDLSLEYSHSHAKDQFLGDLCLPYEEIYPIFDKIISGEDDVIIFEICDIDFIREKFDILNLSTCAIVPLFSVSDISPGEIVGVIVADNPVANKNVSDDNRVWLSDFARRAGDTVENSRFLQRMIENEKLVLLGKAAEIVAHEMRDPLFAIRTRTQLLASNSEDEIVIKAAEQIERNTERLESVISNQLRYVTKPELKFRMFDIGELIEDVISEPHISEPMDQNKIEFKLVQPRIPNPVCVDAGLIKDALRNIIKNAIEVMTDGGVLTVKILTSKEKLIIIIHDTGPGISTTEFPILDSVFEPYRSTKSLTDKSGSGLGLAIARKFVEYHGGSIHVENLEYGGACFRLIIPIEQGV